MDKKDKEYIKNNLKLIIEKEKENSLLDFKELVEKSLEGLIRGNRYDLEVVLGVMVDEEIIIKDGFRVAEYKIYYGFLNSFEELIPKIRKIEEKFNFKVPEKIIDNEIKKWKKSKLTRLIKKIQKIFFL